MPAAPVPPRMTKRFASFGLSGVRSLKIRFVMPFASKRLIWSVAVGWYEVPFTTIGGCATVLPP